MSIDRPFTQYLFVAALAAGSVLWALGVPAWTEHECLVVGTADNMVHPDRWINPRLVASPVPANTPHNHWLVPVFNGKPRLKKTPLPYWSVATLLSTGLPLNEFTSRLPSALAATLTTLLVFALARSLFSPRVALISVVLLITSVGFRQWAPSARTEILLLLFMTLTMTCLYFGLNSCSNGRTWLWFLAAGLSAGFGGLAKQCVPLLLGLPVLAYFAWQSSRLNAGLVDRSRRRLVVYISLSLAGLVLCLLVQHVPTLRWWTWIDLIPTLGVAITLILTLLAPLAWYLRVTGGLKRLPRFLPPTLAATVVMLLLFLPWIFYMARLFPSTSDVFRSEVASRFSGMEVWDHPRTSVFYLRSLAGLLLPWTVVFPFALALPFMERFHRHRNSLVFLFLWMLGLVLVLSASFGKAQRYILPALPPACLLVGFLLDDLFFTHRWLSFRRTRPLIAFFSLVLLSALVAAVWSFFLPSSLDSLRAFHLLVIAGVGLFPALVALVAAFTHRPKLALLCLFLAVLFPQLAFATRADLWERHPDCVRLPLRAASFLPPDAHVASWGLVSYRTVLYFRRPLPDARLCRDLLISQLGRPQASRLWDQWFYGREGPRWIFAAVDARPELDQMGFSPVLLPERDCWNRTPALFQLRPGYSPPPDRTYSSSQFEDDQD